MKTHRPVVSVKDKDGTPIVRVPLSPTEDVFAEIELDDWNRLLQMGHSGVLNYVGNKRLYPTIAGSSPGKHHLVGRVLMGATLTERVEYKDGNPRNLRRSNLAITPVKRRIAA